MMDQYSTTSLILATLLKLHDIEAERMEAGKRGGRTVVRWMYQPSARLRELVVEFEEHKAAVEPQEFVYCMNRMRREMFEFLERECPK